MLPIKAAIRGRWSNDFYQQVHYSITKYAKKVLTFRNFRDKLMTSIEFEALITNETLTIQYLQSKKEQFGHLVSFLSLYAQTKKEDSHCLSSFFVASI